MAKDKPKLLRGGLVVGAISLGVGGGIAVERAIVKRLRGRQDPYKDFPYGLDVFERTSTLLTDDKARLVVYENRSKENSRGLIFLHGYAIDSGIWFHQANELGYRCILYDARHHGASIDAPMKPVDMARLAADLGAVIEHSGLEEVVLVGHSMGGMTLLEFAGSTSGGLKERVKGLVIVNANFADRLDAIYASRVLKAIDRRIRLDGSVNDPVIRGLFRLRGDDLSWLLVRYLGFGSDASPTQVSYVRSLLQRFPTDGLLSVLPALRKHDVKDSMEKIDIPTLVVTGDSDRIASPEASRIIASTIPDSRLEEFENSGHIVPLERPERFNEILQLFLEEAFGAPRRSGVAG